VKIYCYQNGFLHQKVMLLGGEAFAAEVETMLDDNFSNSRQVYASDYTEASFWFKLIVRVSRLLARIQ
jgi:hypothetical protein